MEAVWDDFGDCDTLAWQVSSNVKRLLGRCTSNVKRLPGRCSPNVKRLFSMCSSCVKRLLFGRCASNNCRHNIQNECHQTRTCIKGQWSEKRAKFTPAEKILPWQHYHPLYDPMFRTKILETLAECPGIRIPPEYHWGHHRPTRPTRYRGTSLQAKP